MQIKSIAFLLAILAATVQSANAAAITNLSGVYDVNTDRIAISFHIDPIPTGVDSFYFDLDVFPSPPVFDPATTILFSTVPGAVIDQLFLQESIWIDFPTVVTNPLNYSIIFQVADASAIAGPLNVDMYLNPDFGDHPSALPAWVFADIMTMNTGSFTPGDILMPEPSTPLLVLCSVVALFGRARRLKCTSHPKSFRR